MAQSAYMTLPFSFALLNLIGFPLLVIVYRLFFHSLAKIPGPKLAALSRLYEFYYDCILGGKFVFKIEELHEQYGECLA